MTTTRMGPSSGRARGESLSVLDGVIPYVLVTGNHDYGLGGDVSTLRTLLNKSFNAAQNSLNDPEQGYSGRY